MFGIVEERISIAFLLPSHLSCSKPAFWTKLRKNCYHWTQYVKTERNPAHCATEI